MNEKASGEKPRGAITARELMDRLEKDPEYQRRTEEKRTEHEKRVAELKRTLAPVIADLRAAGYDFDSLDQLRHSLTKYSSAIPILLRWLPRISSPDAKESIVRTLSVPWARPEAGPLLIEEFKNAPKNDSLSQWHALRWAIGNGLEVLAEPALLTGILEIVSDKTNGTARQMAVLALGKIRDPRSVGVLIKLLDDEQVAGHAIMALRKLKASEALDHLAKFSDHPQTWIRNEAKKAITTIMKSRTKPDKI